MSKYRTKLLIVMQLCSIAVLTLLIAASASAQASATDSVTPPPVPARVRVPEGNEAFLVGHAVGTQNYVCVPCTQGTAGCPNGVAFNLFTPQATLFDDQGGQIINHFNSPNLNPKENGIIRATWQHSHDTSTVWARAVGVADSSTDPDFVRSDSIAWLLLNVKDIGTQEGPTGGDKLIKTTFIQRLNTIGGLAPATGCAATADIGNRRFVPYTADYFFYKATNK